MTPGLAKIIYGPSAKMKQEDPLLKAVKSPDIDSSALNPRAGKDLLSIGPGWSHRPHAHEAARI